MPEYDNGGFLPPGPSHVANLHEDEYVISPEKLAELHAKLDMLTEELRELREEEDE